MTNALTADAPTPAHAAWRKQMRTLSIVILIAGGSHVALCLIRLVMQPLTKPMMRIYFGFLESMAPTAKVTGMLGPLETYMDNIASAEAMRTVPFLACAVWLLVIGRRIGRFERPALATLKTWAIAAGVAIVISTCIQVFITLPATLAYSEAITRTMPAMPPAGSSGAPPFDVRQLVGMITTAATGVGIVFGALMMAVFPIVMVVWSGKVDRATPA